MERREAGGTERPSAQREARGRKEGEGGGGEGEGGGIVLCAGVCGTIVFDRKAWWLKGQDLEGTSYPIFTCRVYCLACLKKLFRRRGVTVGGVPPPSRVPLVCVNCDGVESVDVSWRLTSEFEGSFVVQTKPLCRQCVIKTLEKYCFQPL